MKTPLNISTGSSRFTNLEFATVAEAITAFATTHNLQRLTHIAEGRLHRLASGAPGQRLRGLHAPGDFVHQAVALILLGRRKPRAHNLSSLDAFNNYVQGIMQSLINHELDRVIRQGQHIPIESLVENHGQDEPSAAGDVIHEISLAETREALFPHLREHAKNNPAMLAAINAWEESWPLADRIPKGTMSDKQTHALRVKAREVLQKSSAQDGISMPTGKEPFMP